VHLHRRGAEGDVVLDALGLEPRAGQQAEQGQRRPSLNTQRRIPVKGGSEW
jgi:hypothetical protein